MIFSLNSNNVIDVYSRVVKQAPRLNINKAACTSLLSTVTRDWVTQGQNDSIGHLFSDREVRVLCNVQYAYKDVAEGILLSGTPGFIRVLTVSHRLPIPIPVNCYDDNSLLVEDKVEKATGS